MNIQALLPAGAREAFPRDFLASVVVFLVALPLCLGIAIASGASPAAGLITGIVGGLVVGAIAGSPLQVSGPAAGLTVIVYEIIQTHGIAMLGVIGVVAGLLQVVASIVGLGRWFRAISPAVIQGMLAGIGALIIASQLHVMVDDKPRENGVANILAIPEAFMKGVAPLDGSVHHLAAGVGIATILAMIAWGFVPAKWRMVPAALVGVAVGTGIAAWFDLPIRYVDLPNSLTSAIAFPGLTNFARVFEGPILAAIATLAVVASAETMLTASAVDRMHNGVRTDYDKELRAQGIGNALCGALGGLPMTGVIVRSSANIQAGATTRTATMLHGLWILLFVAAMPWLLERVPLTALAALLVYTGAKLLSPAALKQLRAYGWGEVGIYVATAVAIVATNLLEGIMIGFGLALFKMLWSLSHLETRLDTDPDTKEATLTMQGAGTFLGVPRLVEALAAVPPGCKLTVDLSHLSHVDHAFLEALSGWEKEHLATNGHIVLDWDGLHDLHAAGRPSSQRQRVAASSQP